MCAVDVVKLEHSCTIKWKNVTELHRNKSLYVKG
jgi:hypothetical protein